MSVATRTKATKLSAYESEQIRRIAAWKSEPPNPLNELWKRVSLPVAREVERLIPDASVRAAIIKAYDVSERLAGQGAIKRRAGVRDLAELKHKPLEECDALAAGVERSAEILALAEGAATGVGGMITTLLDVPLLFVLSLGTIRKIGHCYGHALESHRDVNFVLGVLIAAMAGTPEARRARINRLRELEELLIEEIQEEIFAEEVLSFLFQIEIFAGIPGVGLLSGAALNGLFMRRVCEFARLAFQEALAAGKRQGPLDRAGPGGRAGTGWAGAGPWDASRTRDSTASGSAWRCRCTPWPRWSARETTPSSAGFATGPSRRATGPRSSPPGPEAHRRTADGTRPHWRRARTLYGRVAQAADPSSALRAPSPRRGEGDGDRRRRGEALDEMTERSPSPRRGEGRAEGDAALRNPTAKHSNSITMVASVRRCRRLPRSST